MTVGLLSGTLAAGAGVMADPAGYGKKGGHARGGGGEEE